MNKRISNLGTYEFLILYSLNILMGLAILITIWYLFFQNIREFVWFGIILTLISLFMILFILRTLRFVKGLVEVTLTKDCILVSRFAKKDEIKYSNIKVVKYFYLNYYPLLLREPDIKITFFTPTKFGTSIYFRPTQLDKDNSLNLDLDILSILKDKIKN